MAATTKKSLSSFTAAALMTFVMTSLPCPGDAWQKDIKIKYYAGTVLRCNENLTTIPNTKVFWITPDNVVIDNSTTTTPKHVSLVNGTVVSMLNVTNVSDDQFGYYTCVMVDDTSGKVMVARWGLNVDGADFSALEKEYRENAVVGAIAASVMLVLVGGSCLIWHYRYHKRAGQGKGKGSAAGDDDDEVNDDLKKPSAAESHVNEGYDDRDRDSAPAVATATVDIEMVEPPKDMSNGTSGTVADDVKM